MEKNYKNLKIEELDFSKSKDGIIPAVIQDDVTLKVLMLGYMNRESLEKTLQSGKVTFYSRSRATLWTKGETSGNFMEVVDIYKDCDNDTLLVRVNPMGPACHRGTLSCFDTPDNEGFIKTLQRVIEGRYNERPEGSYTTRLFEAGAPKIAQKVGEEAVETVIEAVKGCKERYIYEASDLIYHLLVLNCHMGCTIADLEDELVRRHK